MFLALLLLDRWLAYWSGGSSVGLGVAAALLGLARPEGLPIALLLAAVAMRGPSNARRRLWPWLGVAAGLLAMLVQRIATGSWVGTSVAEKGLLPNYGIVETLALASKYGVDILRGLLLGFYPAEAPIGFAQGFAAFAFPPLGLLAILLAAARPPDTSRLALRSWLATVAVVFALTGPNVFMGVHFNRYVLWAFPGLLAIAAAGVGIATRLLARDDVGLERALFKAAAVLVALLAALSTARFAAMYAEMAGETFRREIPMADWIRRNLPPGIAIGTATTSVEYLSGHRSLNLHGVTSAAFLGTRTADREAGMFESLVRLPASERPGYLLLTRGIRDGSPLYQAVAPDEPVFETTSLGDDLALFRARWDLLDGGARPMVPATAAVVGALSLVDRLNVCDSADEKRHGYSFESRLGEVLLGGSVEIDRVELGGASRLLADAGRLIVGHERFRIRTSAGRDLVIVTRTHGTIIVGAMRAQGPRAVSVDVGQSGILVSAGGRRVLRASLANTRGWNEHVLRVPATAVGSGSTLIEISGRYGSFGYWFYQ